MTPDTSITSRQRLATNITLLVTLVALTGGLILRGNIEGASLPYVDGKAGISVRYPVNWLLSRGTAATDYVMLVEDPGALPFKTVLSISVLTTGPDATISDVTEVLNVRRASQLSSYKTLTIEPTMLAGRAATRMTYAYSTSETNPSLKSLPVIVAGTDYISVSRGQTYVITFLSEAGAVERNQRYLDLFLRRLELQN